MVEAQGKGRGRGRSGLERLNEEERGKKNLVNC